MKNGLKFIWNFKLELLNVVSQITVIGVKPLNVT